MNASTISARSWRGCGTRWESEEIMDDGKIAGDEHGQCRDGSEGMGLPDEAVHSDPWFAFELGLNMLALFAEPSRQVEKGSYLREEWIDGPWVSLGDDPWGSLAHARTAVASMPRWTATWMSSRR
jgi:hypothetical protein